MINRSFIFYNEIGALKKLIILVVSPTIPMRFSENYIFIKGTTPSGSNDFSNFYIHIKWLGLNWKNIFFWETISYDINVNKFKRTTKGVRSILKKPEGVRRSGIRGAGRCMALQEKKKFLLFPFIN